MAWIIELVGALANIRSAVKGDSVPSGPLTQKEIQLLKKEISNLILKGENAYNQDLYSHARKDYIKAYQFEGINPESISDSVNLLKDKIKQVEDILNKEKIEKLTLIIERGDKLKIEAKFQKANHEYQKAFNIIKDMIVFDQDLRSEKINEIYLMQIQSLIEQGVKLKSGKLFEKAVETFKKAMDLAELMIISTEKEQIIKAINKNLDTYSIKISEKIELGNQLMGQKKYDESKQAFQIALNLVKEKYSSLSNSIANRFNATNEIRELNSLINQVENKITINNSMSKNIKPESLPVATEQPSLPSKPSIPLNDQTPPIKSPPKKIIKIPTPTLTRSIKIERVTKGREEEKPKVTFKACNFCGNKLGKKARFCPQCGTKFKKK